MERGNKFETLTATSFPSPAVAFVGQGENEMWLSLSPEANSQNVLSPLTAFLAAFFFFKKIIGVSSRTATVNTKMDLVRLQQQTIKMPLLLKTHRLFGLTTLLLGRNKIIVKDGKGHTTAKFAAMSNKKDSHLCLLFFL